MYFWKREKRVTIPDFFPFLSFTPFAGQTLTMFIPTLQQWPGATLSFFYFILVVVGAQLGVAADGTSTMLSDVVESVSDFEKDPHQELCTLYDCQ